MCATGETDDQQVSEGSSPTSYTSCMFVKASDCFQPNHRSGAYSISKALPVHKSKGVRRYRANEYNLVLFKTLAILSTDVSREENARPSMIRENSKKKQSPKIVS
jgi:hypothetical protein